MKIVNYYRLEAMLLFQNKNKAIYSSTIKINCVIISAILLFALMFSSCVAPRSVRPKGYNISKKDNTEKNDLQQQKNENSNSTNTSNDVNEIDNSANSDNIKKLISDYTQSLNPIAGVSDDSPSPNDSSSEQSNILLPLNEQITAFLESQDEIKNDIKDIKSILNDINKKIAKNPVTTAKKKKNTKPEIPRANNDDGDDNIMISDEALEKQKQKIEDRKNSQKSKSIPEKGNSNKKPVNYNVDNNKPNSSKKNPSKTKGISNKKINLAKAALDNKNYTDAINKLGKLISEMKDPVAINICNFYLGESHFGLKQYDKAVDFYKKVLNTGHSENSDNAQIMIAEAKIRSGKVIEAKQAFEKFVRTYPKSELMPTARKMLQQL